MDLEEWHDTVLFEGAEPGPSRFREDVLAVLALLERRGAKATFFMLGRLADGHPAVAREIKAAGHEIACHGYTHRSLWRMSAPEFAEDLRRAREAIKEACGEYPAGYRSPTWSLKGREAKFLPLIKAAGFSYDASLYPLTAASPRAPYEVIPGLTEFPPSVFRFLGLGLPFLGGTFLRLATADFMRRRVAALNRAGLPAVLYLHPWEFAPAPTGLPFYKRAVQYYNVSSVPVKADVLLAAFEWGTMRSVLGK